MFRHELNHLHQAIDTVDVRDLNVGFVKAHRTLGVREQTVCQDRCHGRILDGR
jgi:hypothetical protein